MKRAIGTSIALASALAAWAQAPSFERPPPAWQVALAATPDANAGAAIATKGQGAVVACGNCHGANGIPAAGAPFPRLAGLPMEYIAKQLFDYRDGSRASALMAPIAKGLGDADVASLARYYASLDPPRGTPDHGSQRARQLARYGDNGLALPACVDCHGSASTGGGPILPGLAQPAAYTTAQLTAFRSRERKNDGDGIMQSIASRLSDADIHALGEYFETYGKPP
jgi:cytochrome c553